MKNFKNIIIYFIFFVPILFSTNISAKNFNTLAVYAKIVDSRDNEIIIQKNQDTRMYPASLTKMMLLYVVFDKLKSGDILMTDKVKISKKAASNGNASNGVSSMFLVAQNTVSILDLIIGTSVVSGNDSAYALAEHISISESDFIKLMNAYSKKLQLNNTNWDNVEGFHTPNNYTTASDIVKLANSLIKDFPEYYYFFSIQSFEFNNIKQNNRNTLLYTDIGYNIKVDGLKTGYTDISKASLAFSATGNYFNNKLDTRRITGVVSGLKDPKERINEAKKIILWSFSNNNEHLFYKKGDTIVTIPLFNSAQSELHLTANTDIFIIADKNIKKSSIKAILTYNKYIVGKVSSNQVLATVNIYVDNEVYKSYNIIYNKNINEQSIILKFILSPYYAIKKYFLIK